MTKQPPRDSLDMVITATKHMLRRPICFYPALAEIAGSLEAGIFLSQACYWSTRTEDDDGWFFKTQEHWNRETFLSRRNQETARKKLRDVGVLEEKRRGVPAKLYFRINWAKLQGLLGDLEIVPPSMSADAIQGGTPPPNSSGRTRQSFTSYESTSESTSESKRQRFAPPTNEQVTLYMLSRGIPNHQQEAQKFIDHHEARGWKYARGLPMQDWEAAVRTWQGNMESFKASNGNGKPRESYDERIARENEETARRVLARHGIN